MLNYIRVYNIISIILLFSGASVIFTEKLRMIDCIIGVYTFLSIPFIAILLLNKSTIDRHIPMINNIYFYIVSLVFFNYGLLLLGINYNTMGCGIIVIGCALFNLFYGIFDKADNYIPIVDTPQDTSLLENDMAPDVDTVVDGAVMWDTD